MGGARGPILSIIIATRNRAEVLVSTLRSLESCGMDRGDREVIVVDNASQDATVERITGLVNHVIPLRSNRGSCAKAIGCEIARGSYILFLDDDSFPRPGSIGRMIDVFEREPCLGAAGFRVHLPDGEEEASALPGVFVGCGVGLRASALQQSGGLDLSFFMQAEEYDLSFRLKQAGWDVRVVDDLHVEHFKTSTARISNRTMFYDVRNNLRVVNRYLPAIHRRIYERDWLLRYRWLAERESATGAYCRGAITGRSCGWRDRWKYRNKRLDDGALEFFFRWRETERRMEDVRAAGARRILLADWGKNVFAFQRAVRVVGMSVVAIADDRFGATGRRYRGTPIIPVEEAMRQPFDAVVVSNMAGAFARKTRIALGQMTGKAIHSWFEPERAHDTTGIGRSSNSVVVESSIRGASANQRQRSQVSVGT